MEYIIIALKEMDDGQRVVVSSGDVLGEYYGKTFATREEAEEVAEQIRTDMAGASELVLRVVAAEPTHTRQLTNPLRRPREPRLPGRPMSELGPFRRPPEDGDDGKPRA